MARTLGGEQVVSIVSESGLYRAILNRNASAKAMPGMAERIDRFKDWIVEEVLPSIRETGSDVVPTAVPAPVPVDPLALLEDPAVLRGLLGRYALIVEHEREGRLVAEAAVEAAAPAVAFVGALADSDRLWGLHAAARALHQGPVTFVRWLRGRGDLYDLNGSPVPKEPLIKRGHFKVSFEMYGGEPRPTTKITGKGLVPFARELDVRPPVLSPQGLLPGF